ncbi:glycosyl hydrolase family 28-related protein [Klebsiella pneumoniae]|uniref:glycosyl hydrolase family 28-related protein n=1 Tax=Pseudomonadota TaxID=1224 RepID=UPI00215014ED|nr:glycosyl hydrolase family 28-related protein [Burkholderia contaminans]UUX38605.1 hypothetical protein NTJ56_07300 [Burkholderia contaminans]
MIKKILLTALLVPAMALAQTYPSPTFNSLTLQNPLTPANGGTGATSATGTGSAVLSTSPTIASPTITGALTATGLVTTGDLATQAANSVLANVTGSIASPTATALPSCSTSSSALTYTSGTGFACNSAVNAATLGGATFAAPGSIGLGTPGSGAFTSLSSNGATSFGAAPTLGTTTLYPTVPTNAALQAVATTTTSTITRLGFYAAGDAPPLTYTASASACSLSSGNGDNGSQVKSADSKCWLANFPSGPEDVREWGAKGDGSTDNTTAMNAAHATGAVILYPAGTWNFTTLNAFSSGGIVGLGRTGTRLNSTDTSSANLIVFNGSAYSPIFKDFALTAPVSSNLPVKTGGACLQLNPTSGEIDYAHFDNVTIAYCPIGIDFVAAAYWSINNSEFLGYNAAGIQVANTNNTDTGDSVVQGSLFNTPGTAGVALLWKSSGGLKVIGNKLLGGNVGFGMQFNGASNTSDILLIGNSIENMTSQAISLARTSGTSNVSNIVIVGNQMGVEPACLQTDASGFINELTYTGNVCNLSSSTGYGVQLTSITDFNISGNTFKGNGGGPTGISIASSSSNGKIGKNVYATLSTTVSNSSTSTIVGLDTQTGTTTTAATGWSGYGTLFSSPTTTVTFPNAYTVAPTASNITMTPTSTNGALGYLVTAVSTTGFSYIAISSVTNVAASFSWQAGGIK